jgi:hypothetical protein
VGFSRRVPPERSFAGDRQPNRRDPTLQRKRTQVFGSERLEDGLALFAGRGADYRICPPGARRYSSYSFEGEHDD